MNEPDQLLASPVDAFASLKVTKFVDRFREAHFARERRTHEGDLADVVRTLSRGSIRLARAA